MASIFSGAYSMRVSTAVLGVAARGSTDRPSNSSMLRKEDLPDLTCPITARLNFRPSPKKSSSLS